MSLTQEFIFRAGEVQSYIETVKNAGITDLIMVNGNYATRYPEMVNSVLGGAQWNFDRHVRPSYEDGSKKFGFLITSDSDHCLNTLNQTEKLRPAATGMDEIERVLFILNPMRAQFAKRADGMNVVTHAVLYDGIMNGTEMQMTEFEAIRDAGINLAVTSKSWPWHAPHPFGTSVWFADKFDEFVTMIWTDPTQGSLMEKDIRAGVISKVGDEIPAESIQRLEQCIAAGTIVNLHDEDAYVTYKGQSINGSNGEPLIVKPEIGPHGAPYMGAAKPHVPHFKVEEAAKAFIRFEMP